MANEIINTRNLLAARKRKVFIKVLSKCGSVSAAAKACGHQDTSTFQRYRRDHEDFADEWSEALEAAANVLEDEAIRRAVDGVLEPTFYKGDIVGHTRKHSDTLMMFMLRGLKPDTYRENVRGGGVHVNFGIAVLPMTAQSDEAWENRALEMHKGQKIIEIEAKPTENAMLRVKRGD